MNVSRILVIFLTLYAFSADLLAQNRDWTSLTRDLRAEKSSVVERARAHLRDIPNLDSLLAAGLKDENREFALIVIRELRRKSLLPSLISIAMTESDFRVFSTLNSFIDAESRQKIGLAYLERLNQNTGLDAPAKLAVLDGLKQLDVVATPAKLAALLGDPSSDVRIATAALAGAYRVKRRLPDFGGVLRQALSSNPMQVRAEALVWIGQLRDRSEFSQSLRACLKDPNPDVRRDCEEAAKP